MKAQCRGKDGALLLYDTTNVLSLTNAQKHLEMLAAEAPNCSVILVGTKTDLRKDQDVTRRGLRRAQSEFEGEDQTHVTTADGQAVANDLKIAQFFEVSAKTATNVNECMEALITAMDKHEAQVKDTVAGAAPAAAAAPNRDFADASITMAHVDYEIAFGILMGALNDFHKEINVTYMHGKKPTRDEIEEFELRTREAQKVWTVRLFECTLSLSLLSLSLSLSLAALEIGANEDVSLEVWRGHS